MIGTLLGLVEPAIFVSCLTGAGFSFTIGAEAGDVGLDLSTEIVFLKGALAGGIETAEMSFSVSIFFPKVPVGSEVTFSLALLAFISDNLAA